VATDANPFAALSLIVAPAILTNACSVLIMSTSNRFARTVDRSRELARELDQSDDFTSETGVRRLRELGMAEERSLLLLSAMRSAYVALSAFATATLLSLLGAVLVPAGQTTPLKVVEGLAILAGMLAVGALVNASILLVRETRLTVVVLRERAAGLRFRATREKGR
jgi:hypothetical protein